ncbi:MAG TPA: C25 family cysteine peptidase [Pirellulaceae bacterium]|jgi:hypothetical protein|nr:C25 family cysteine peptidase [Pirellulaceae bacterium]
MAAWLILTTALAWQPTAPAAIPPVRAAAPVQAAPVHAAAANADVLVVCPPAYREALRPWLEHRAMQGHALAFAASPSSATDLQAEIRARQAAAGLKTVLIVGDVPKEDGLQRAPSTGVPTFTIPAKINVRFGSTPEIGTDLPYADVDDDGIPDLALGRWPVDSAEEVATYVRRSLAYERRLDQGSLDQTAWQREIDVVCGVGGFGWLVDKLLEDVTRKLLVEEIPAEYDVRVTYANWRSPFCPDPRAFGERIVSRIESGPLFWVYVGHGHRRTLDRLHVEGDDFPILDETTCDFRGQAPGRSVAVLLACYAGAFDHREDCLAESMLRDEEGPVAVIASSRVAMPYAMSVLARGMMHERFAGGEKTLGELFLAAKRQMSAPVENPDETRKLMDTLARAMSPHREELQAELDEHQALFHLLGDPLLRLPRQESLKLAAPAEAAPGETIEIAADLLPADVCRVELVSRRDGRRHDVPYRGGDVYASDWSDWTRSHELANDKSWETWDLSLDRATSKLALALPAEAIGDCYLRCIVSRDGKIVCAATPIRIVESESD